MLIYSKAEGVVLDGATGQFVIPYDELEAVHHALAVVECNEGNVYDSPCPCVRHGANRATVLCSMRREGANG